jgi:hypothetical protein
MAGRPAPLEERFWSKVEKTETCWNWTASRMTSGYGQIGIGGKYGRPHGAHRVAYELAVGPIPEGMQVDHMCHNKLCVNPDHLRAVTNKQNNEHLTGAKKNSKSGIRGVSWRSEVRKWQAQVGHNGKNHNLGLFAMIEDAEAAVIAKRLELFTHNDLDRKAA